MICRQSRKHNPFKKVMHNDLHENELISVLLCACECILPTENVASVVDVLAEKMFQRMVQLPR